MLAGLSTQAAFAQNEPSAGDVAQARELFNRGLRQREGGDAGAALEKFKAALSLVRTPIVALELGRTYTQLGKLIEARETFLSIARIPVRSEETARSTAARNQSASLADEIRVRLASVTIRVTWAGSVAGAGSGAVTVSVDGAAIPGEALATARLVDPGVHGIVAKAADGTTSETRVDLREGEAREVELTLGAAPPSIRAAGAPLAAGGTESADSTPAAKASTAMSPVVYAGIGLAGAGVIAGTVTGLLAISKESSISDACRGGLGCPNSIHEDLQAGRTMGDVSTVSFAAAGAGAIVAILGVVLSGHKEAPGAKAGRFTPWLAPNVAGIRGAF